MTSMASTAVKMPETPTPLLPETHDTTSASHIPPPGSPFDYAAPVQAYPYPATIPHPFLPLAPVVSSPSDDRKYSVFILPNGLRCCVVSDPHSTKAACSLDVFTGHQSDGSLSGCAHFTEHMLFMGTEKYPAEDEYSQYLAANGGSSNASTSGQHTNYYFNVTADKLEPAIDRFANFFISPLFGVSSTGREVNAVDSEFLKNVNQDSRRIYHYTKGTGNPCCPENQFGSGNKATLLFDRQAALAGKSQAANGGIDATDVAAAARAAVTADKQAMLAREQMMEFFRTHYSANNMCVCVVGKETIPELQNLCSEKFGGIRNFNKIPEYVDMSDIDIWAPMSLKEMQALRARANVSYTTNPIDMWAEIQQRRYIPKEYILAGKEKFQAYLKTSGNPDNVDVQSGLLLAPGSANFLPHTHANIPGVTEPAEELSSIDSGKMPYIPNSESASPVLVREVAYPGMYGQVSYVVPIANIRQLLLRWKLPPMRRGWLAPAGDILARIIGHEGAGSLKSYLQSHGLVTGLNCNCSNLAPDNATFSVSIVLTEQGVAQVDTVVKNVFEYFLLVCNTSNEQLNVITKDMILTSNNDFTFMEKEPVADLASDLAGDLHSVTVPPLLPLPITEHSDSNSLSELTASEKPKFSLPSPSDLERVSRISTFTPSLLLRYDNMLEGLQMDSVHHLLALLTPSRVRIDMIAKEVEKLVPITQREGHYGVVYGVAKILRDAPVDGAAANGSASMGGEDVAETGFERARRHPAAKWVGKGPESRKGTAKPFQVNDSVVCDEYGDGLLYWPWMSDVEQHMYALLSPYHPDYQGFRKISEISEPVKNPNITSPLLPMIQQRADKDNLSFHSIPNDVLKQRISIEGCYILGKNDFIPTSFKIPVEPLPENTPLNAEGVPEQWTWEMLGLLPVSVAANLVRKRDATNGVLSSCKLTEGASAGAASCLDGAAAATADDDVVPADSLPTPAADAASEESEDSVSVDSEDGEEGQAKEDLDVVMPDAWYLRPPTSEELDLMRRKYPNNTSLVELSNLAIRERIPLRYRIQTKTPTLINYTPFSENWFVPQLSHITDKSLHKLTISVPGTLTHLSAESVVYLDILLKYLGRVFNDLLNDAGEAGVSIDISEDQNGITMSTEGYMEPNYKAFLLLNIALRQAVSNISIGNIISNQEYRNSGLHPSQESSDSTDATTDTAKPHYLVSGLNLDMLANVTDFAFRTLTSLTQQSPLHLAAYLAAQVQELSNTTRSARLQEILQFQEILAKSQKAYSEGDLSQVQEHLQPFFSFARHVLARIHIQSLSAGCERSEAISIAKSLEDILTDASLSGAAAAGSHRAVLQYKANMGASGASNVDSIAFASAATTTAATGATVSALVAASHAQPLLPIALHAYTTPATATATANAAAATPASTGSVSAPTAASSPLAAASSLFAALAALPKPLALAAADQHEDRTVLVQPGEHVFLRAHATNHNDQNSAVRVAFQLRNMSPYVQACSKVLDALMRKRIFNQLRTKETLGYLVSSGTMVRNNVGMFVISVQSTQDATYLYNRVETTLWLVRQELEALPDAGLYSVVNALIAEHTATSQSFEKHANAYYSALYGKTFDFAKRWEMLQNLRNLEKKDILNFLDQYILGYDVKTVVPYGEYKLTNESRSTEVISPFSPQSTFDYDISLTLNTLRSAVDVDSLIVNNSGLGDGVANAIDLGLKYNDIAGFQQSVEEINNSEVVIPEDAKVVTPTTRSVVAVLVNHYSKPFPSHPFPYTPVRGSGEKNSEKSENAEASVAIPLEPTVLSVVEPDNISIVSDTAAFQRCRTVAAAAMNSIKGSVIFRGYIRKYLTEQAKKR